MLNPSTLQKLILQAIQDCVTPALRQGFLCTFPEKSNAAENIAKKFAETVVEIMAEPLAESLTECIDFYVKSISINGTIITNGSPTTHTAVISSPKYITNGKIPNSLGIS